MWSVWETISSEVAYLPTRSREYMLVTLIPASFHNLARMGLVLLNGSVGQEPYIVVDVKVE